MLLLTLCCILVAAQVGRPPVVVAVAYPGPVSEPPDAGTVRRDLSAIRRAGFNAIEVPVAANAAIVKAAAEVGLWVIDGTRARDDRSATRIDVGSGALSPPRARLAFWGAIASGARTVTFADTQGGAGPGVLALGETAGIVSRNEALFDPLRPRAGGVREISGAPRAALEVKLLESAELWLIIAVHDGSAATRVMIAFDAEIPEAIWQNLETGTSVSFVMTPTGPVLEHTFAPRDTLVLTTRKRLRF